MDVQPMTRIEATRLGYIRPKNGGEGRAWSRRLTSGLAVAVVVDEGHRSQYFYKLIEASDEQ